MSKTAEATIRDIEPVFTSANIIVIRKFDNVEGRSFEMDIEAILLNLLTNAYTACLQVKRERNVRVEIHQKEVDKTGGVEIVVADSGPGVDAKFKDRIWDPLFSTKVDREGKQIGTGLGLTIVDSIVNDLNGTRCVKTNEKLKGAQFIIWLPLD